MSLFYKKSRDIFFYNRQVSKGWYFMLRFLIRGVVGTGCISLISFNSITSVGFFIFLVSVLLGFFCISIDNPIFIWNRDTHRNECYHLF